MTELRNDHESKPLGLVWIDCPYPVAAIGLARILESAARVHVGREVPTGESPSLIIIFPIYSEEGLSESMKRIRKTNPDTPVLVFGLHPDPPLVRAALKVGARGFIHAMMQPEQVIRALEVAAEGEIVVPRKLLKYLISDEDTVDFDVLSARQREILELVGEGLSNAQISKRLFLAESTVKQHLRAAYKLLGVSNRTEAAKVVRNAS